MSKGFVPVYGPKSQMSTNRDSPIRHSIFQSRRFKFDTVVSHEKQLKCNFSFLTISGLLGPKFIATKVWKLFYLLDLDEIYQMQPSLLKLDLAFRFYDSIRSHFLDYRL